MPRGATTMEKASTRDAGPVVVPISAGYGQEVVIPVTDMIRKADEIVIRLNHAVGGLEVSGMLCDQFGAILSVTARAAATLPPALLQISHWG